MPEFELDEREHVSLCEALDRILNKGALVMGEVTISVANVDLIYLGLKVMLASVETVRREMDSVSNFPSLRRGPREEAKSRHAVK